MVYFFYLRVFTAVTWLTGARLPKGDILSRHWPHALLWLGWYVIIMTQALT
jgi:hypothetical protein